MKINYEFVNRKIFDEYYLVPIGEAAAKFNGIIAINDVSSFIFNCLPECNSVDEIAEKLTEVYDIDSETAVSDIEDFLSVLRKNGIID